MASLLTITPIPLLLLLVAAPSCRAQHPDDEVAVPANFPKAFVTAMAVAIVCVVVLIVLVCVFAQCWQNIIGLRRRRRQRLASRTTAGGRSSSSTLLVPERWLEPVFEWPQQLTPRRSRNNMKRKRKKQQQQQQGLGLGLRDGRCRGAGRVGLGVPGGAVAATPAPGAATREELEGRRYSQKGYA